MHTATVALAPPNLVVDSLFFRYTATVGLDFRFPGAQIRYTTDGSLVDTASMLYDSPLAIQKTCTLRVRSFHPDYLPSSALTLNLQQVAPAPSFKIIELTPGPHPNYPGTGSAGLLDLRKGTTQFHSDQWLGFQAAVLDIYIELQEEQSFEQLVISTLADHQAWIFPPTSVTVLLDNRPVGTARWEALPANSTSQLLLLPVNLAPLRGRLLHIQLNTLGQIPEWHPGKGTLPWLFLDELLFYPAKNRQP